jgi:hypothetical protein
MSITARLVNNPLIQARVTPQDRVLVTNYQINAATLRIADIFDVDATSATDGAFLVYRANTSNWVATVNLDNINTIINGGNF